MLAKKPPLGWNSWNTFGTNINEQLIFEMADRIVDEGYLAAGYEYLVIDDCWSLRQRNEEGLLVPDPEKFPHGMKAVADYVHGKGLKFGMYSCAGTRTCADYPGSYDHEFVDAKTFAEWGVDFLKYDFCFFPGTGNCKGRYQTMSMALKASGREILFSACNWGVQEPWNWMSSVGAHMYRSTGDINDSFVSFKDIFRSQVEHLCTNGSYCFNDMDMLTVGMCGKGNVAVKACTYEEYRMEFALWCLDGVPLMIGADLRQLPEEYRRLLQDPDLLRIDQDEECRQPLLVKTGSVFYTNPDPKPGENPWVTIPDSTMILLRHLSDNQFALAFINFCEHDANISCEFADIGLPVAGGFGLRMKDVFTGEDIGVRSDNFNPHVNGHDMKMYLCTLEKTHA